MDELLTDGFRELSQDEKEVIDGGGFTGTVWSEQSEDLTFYYVE